MFTKINALRLSALWETNKHRIHQQENRSHKDFPVMLSGLVNAGKVAAELFEENLAQHLDVAAIKNDFAARSAKSSESVTAPHERSLEALQVSYGHLMQNLQIQPANGGLNADISVRSFCFVTDTLNAAPAALRGGFTIAQALFQCSNAGADILDEIYSLHILDDTEVEFMHRFDHEEDSDLLEKQSIRTVLPESDPDAAKEFSLDAAQSIIDSKDTGTVVSLIQHVILNYHQGDKILHAHLPALSDFSGILKRQSVAAQLAAEREELARSMTPEQEAKICASNRAQAEAKSREAIEVKCAKLGIHVVK